MSKLVFLPCLDSPAMANARRTELGMPRDVAAALGRSAVEASEQGFYRSPTGPLVDWTEAVAQAILSKVSIRPDDPLPISTEEPFAETRIQVCNETTLGVSHRFVQEGHNVLALNFANGVSAGGGFLGGARAQEENLCRSSALFLTLKGDPMYTHHRTMDEPVSTDWTIYSPNVPIFRTDNGTPLEQFWLLSFLTCAAPFAPAIGQPRSGDLLQKRIHRILAIAKSYGYPVLILGAWGCGAFDNDPLRTAKDFRHALETEFAGAFSDVIFAITDWSEERRFLGPFREVFRS